MNEKWYAVCTKPKSEKKVLSLLNKQKIESFCPMRKVEKKGFWKTSDVEPLFPSYVFVKIEESQYQKVKNTRGVVNFFYWLGNPAVVKEKEIELMKTFASENETLHLKSIPISTRDVVISNGPIVQKEGVIVAAKYKTVNVTLPSLGYVISAEVRVENVEVNTLNNVTYLYPYQQKYNDAS